MIFLLFNESSSKWHDLFGDAFVDCSYNGLQIVDHFCKFK